MSHCFTGPLTACLLVLSQLASGSPSTNEDVVARRGSMKGGTGREPPSLTVSEPTGGWTTNRMLVVAGTCSDTTADPIFVNINGSRYYVRSQAGTFKRKFPAARGKNNVEIQCKNKAGVAKVTRTIDAQISPVKLKIVLSSDTDGVYTDLHIYEPKGDHVYWASTESQSGGLFFLNQEGGYADQPGYGPYLYVHPAPPVGIFKIDANYWPGGAIQHTLATLEVILDEGLPSESRRRIARPLARPGENQTLAFVTIEGDGKPARIFVPGQDPETERPPYMEPERTENEEYGSLAPRDEEALRTAVASLSLLQAKLISKAWDPKQRDCAGLVRFAYREALRQRTPTQRQRLQLPSKLPFPPVSARARMHFANFPNMWQTGFDQSGLPKFSAFASSELLISYDFNKIGKELGSQKDGDILVYKRVQNGQDVYHMMLVAKNRIVYHDGHSQGQSGMKILSIQDLLESPDPTWRPTYFNENFLGVYRWKLFAKPQGTVL